MAKKATTKKAKSIKTVAGIRAGFKPATKKNPYPHMRYGNVSISDISNDAFPEMVQLTLGPTKYKAILGKKYVNVDYAVKAINAEQAESVIGKGSLKVKEELIEAGLIGIDAE
jgi:hypothetical protein